METSPIMKLDYNTLIQYKNENRLKKQVHPLYNLIIWNYSETVQFMKQWDDITKLCRGLITDNQGNIVARSFPKFFNMEEVADQIPTSEPYRVFKKVDGSLGILFYYHQEKCWIFTSRGSFTSEQSIKAMQMLQTQYPNFANTLSKNLSYVFEIIYPENRIVVNYGAEEKLIYLTSYNNETGVEDTLERINMIDNGFGVVNEMIAPSELGAKELLALKNENIENEEGYVVRFESGLRIKIKFSNYLELHRQNVNLNPKTIYEWMKERKIMEEMLTLVSDEFSEYLRTVVNSLQDQYEAVYKSCLEVNDFYLPRKEFFPKYEKHPYKPVLALLYNHHNHAITEETFKQSLYDLIYTKYVNYKTISENFVFTFGSKPQQVFKPRQPKIIILVGVSGSGKSTWANDFVKTHDYSMIVNRDFLRRDLYGLKTESDITDYYKHSTVNDKEKVISNTQTKLIQVGIDNGMTVIVDNTNLTKQYIQSIVKLATKTTEIHIKKFELLPIDLLLDRIRGRPVDTAISRSVLEKQIAQYNSLPEDLFVNMEDIQEIQQNNVLPKCVVFDMDGTLALNHSGRNPYDMTRVEEDDPNECVAHYCRVLHESGTSIIICTARTEDGKDATIRWLNKHAIPFNEIHFRPIGNSTKDFVIKETMWRDIVKRYTIQNMVDDRDQVVEHARRLGFNVFQVNYGNF